MQSKDAEAIGKDKIRCALYSTPILLPSMFQHTKPTDHLVVLRNPTHPSHSTNGYLSPAQHISDTWVRYLSRRAQKYSRWKHEGGYICHTTSKTFNHRDYGRECEKLLQRGYTFVLETHSKRARKRVKDQLGQVMKVAEEAAKVVDDYMKCRNWTPQTLMELEERQRQRPAAQKVLPASHTPKATSNIRDLQSEESSWNGRNDDVALTTVKMSIQEAANLSALDLMIRDSYGGSQIDDIDALAAAGTVLEKDGRTSDDFTISYGHDCNGYGFSASAYYESDSESASSDGDLDDIYTTYSQPSTVQDKQSEVFTEKEDTATIRTRFLKDLCEIRSRVLRDNKSRLEAIYDDPRLVEEEDEQYMALLQRAHLVFSIYRHSLTPARHEATVFVGFSKELLSCKIGPCIYQQLKKVQAQVKTMDSVTNLNDYYEYERSCMLRDDWPYWGFEGNESRLVIWKRLAYRGKALREWSTEQELQIEQQVMDIILDDILEYQQSRSSD